jgi:hypothetical protein
MMNTLTTNAGSLRPSGCLTVKEAISAIISNSGRQKETTLRLKQRRRQKPNGRLFSGRNEGETLPISM